MQVRSACRGRVVDELLLSPKEGCCSVSVIVDLDSTSVASKAFVPGEEHKSVACILVGLSDADLERRDSRAGRSHHQSNLPRKIAHTPSPPPWLSGPKSPGLGARESGGLNLIAGPKSQRTITSFPRPGPNPPNQPRPRRCAMPTETLLCQPRYLVEQGHHERCLGPASSDHDQHLVFNMMESSFVAHSSLAGPRASAGSYSAPKPPEATIEPTTRASTIQSQWVPAHNQCRQNGR